VDLFLKYEKPCNIVLEINKLTSVQSWNVIHTDRWWCHVFWVLSHIHGSRNATWLCWAGDCG